MNERTLTRRQLDRSLQQLQPLRLLTPPRKGWISAIRQALGMSARQLALRLGVSQQRVAQIEKQEVAGGLTIKAMRKVAEGMNCRFVYGFIPQESLEATVNQQAEKVARRRLALAGHTMGLEGQALARQEKEEMLADLISELTSETPTALWNEK